jgi:hypothetical protein
MKEYKAEIYITKIVRYAVETSLKIEAESRDEAQKEIERMLSNYEHIGNGVSDGDTRLLDTLIDLCEDDITSIELGFDNWAGTEIENTDILSIEEAKPDDA